VLEAHIQTLHLITIPSLELDLTFFARTLRGSYRQGVVSSAGSTHPNSAFDHYPKFRTRSDILCTYLEGLVQAGGGQ